MAGVISVESGYMGGHVENPTYRAICTGSTGHVEVVQVTFDPSITTFRDILEVFFAIHDPTTATARATTPGRSTARRFSITRPSRRRSRRK
jgi:peptide-methionine (S)-S-oxide reductase